MTKPLKRLYQSVDGEQMTDAGRRIQKELIKLLKPYAERKLKNGYSSLDLQWMIGSVGFSVTVMSRLLRECRAVEGGRKEKVKR